jgi:hypothetical protein
MSKYMMDEYGSYPREISSGIEAIKKDWIHFYTSNTESFRDRVAIREWIIDNSSGGWAFYRGMSFEMIEIHFENPNDAMLFKLTWL